MSLISDFLLDISEFKTYENKFISWCTVTGSSTTFKISRKGIGCGRCYACIRWVARENFSRPVPPLAFIVSEALGC